MVVLFGTLFVNWLIELKKHSVMKKLLTSVLTLLVMSANAVQLNNKQVANAPMKSFDACIAAKLNGSSGSDYQFNAEFYKDLGVEIPSSREEQSKLSSPIKKISKLQKGDIVFFRTAESAELAISGIVQTTNGSDFTILYCKDGSVKVGNSEYGEFRGNFVHGVHVTTDKELTGAANAYASLQKKAENAAKDVTKQEGSVKSQEDKIVKAEQKVKDKQVKVNEAETKLKDAESKLQAAEDEARAYSDEAASYDRQISELNSNAQSAMANNNSSSYEKQTKSVAKLMEKQAKAKEKAAKANEKIAKAKEDVTKAKNNVTKAQQDVSSAEKDVDKEKTNLEKEKNELEKAVQKSNDLQKQLE